MEQQNISFPVAFSWLKKNSLKECIFLFFRKFNVYEPRVISCKPVSALKQLCTYIIKLLITSTVQKVTASGTFVSGLTKLQLFGIFESTRNQYEYYKFIKFFNAYTYK